MRSVVLVMILANAVAADPRCELPASVQPVVVAVPPPPCHRASAAIEAAIRKALVARYEPAHEGGKADVQFACDGLGPRIREIVIEQGSGHGFTLDEWRARRSATGYDVRGIRYRDVRSPSEPAVALATGTVTLPDLEVARAALAAAVHEIAPPSNGGYGLHGTFSSNDFHVLVRLVDDDGRVLERQFTGYASSAEQDRYLGVTHARDALAAITGVTAAPRAPTADDRELFDERFAAAVPHFDEQYYWWVMERQVQLAEHLGTPRTIAGLKTRLAPTKTDRSARDARAHAVTAIAKITGWKPAGSVETVAKTYLSECKTR